MTTRDRAFFGDADHDFHLTDAMIRAHCKRLLWRCWQELSADDRAAFLAHVQGGRDALHG